jgi:hypothetical protein
VAGGVAAHTAALAVAGALVAGGLELVTISLVKEACMGQKLSVIIYRVGRKRVSKLVKSSQGLLVAWVMM